MQTAINAAQPGDTIIAMDGTYTGTYNLNSAQSGTSNAKITLQAQNLHQAIFDGPNTCSASTAFTVNKQWWVFDGLSIQERYQAFDIDASNTEVKRTIMKDLPFIALNLLFTGLNNIVLRDSVIAFTDHCQALGSGSGTGAIWGGANNDAIRVINTAFIGIGKIFSLNNLPSGSDVPRSPSILFVNDTDDSLFQGNLFLGTQTAGFRVGDGSAARDSVNNRFYDNIYSVTGGMAGASDDCSDHQHQLLNNIFYRAWGGWLTKGNAELRGYHIVRHNTVYGDDLLYEGLTNVNSFNEDAGNCPSPSGINYKINVDFRDNVIYDAVRVDGARVLLISVDGDNANPPAFSPKGYNLIYAENTTQGTADGKYIFAATDRYARPVFTDITNGDFSLRPDSPMYRAGSDGTNSPGVRYGTNPIEGAPYTYLRQSVMRKVVQARVLEQAAGSTQVTFTGLIPGRDYMMWAYAPEPFPSATNVLVQVDGVNAYIQPSYSTQGTFFGRAVPGGPQRWFAYYRARANSSTMTISWSQSGWYSKVRLYELPTADEAYAWMNEATSLAGDLDNSGTVDLSDLRQLIYMLIGQVPPDLAKADLDGSGGLDLSDVRELIQILISP